MDKASKIYIAGHTGLVGAAVRRQLEKEGYNRLIMLDHAELDLMDQKAVANFFKDKAPDYVFLCAARVGGILANTLYPAEFIYENIMIQNNVIHQSYLSGVKRLLFLGSSCIYPKLCPQPIREQYLMTGSLEPTNSSYAVAKISGIEMCWAYNRQYGTTFIPVMPSNLFGPHDNFDLATCHVLPALIRKFHEAKESGADSVTLWGNGQTRREFLHVDDLADACIWLMQQESFDFTKLLFNIGTGSDLTVQNLAEIIRGIVGVEVSVSYDASKPAGTPQKLLDVSRIKSLGWQASIGLEEGIKETYEWYRTVGCLKEGKRS